jgi:hypothetical protein
MKNEEMKNKRIMKKNMVLGVALAVALAATGCIGKKNSATAGEQTPAT